MQRLRVFLFILICITSGLFWGAVPAHASCTNVPMAGSYTISTSCQFPFATIDGVDTTSGTNTSSITVATTKALTVASGQTLVAGSIILTAASVSINLVGTAQIKPGGEYHIFVTDADGDGYPANSTFSTAGTLRRANMTGTYEDGYATTTNLDCGDSNSTAHPGQATPQTGSFTNTATGLSYDWNCNGTQAQTYPSATYTCSTCTNGSGYTSSINTSNGFSGSVPACGVAGTYYTVTYAGCQDPAVGGCSGAYSTSSVTQSCL